MPDKGPLSFGSLIPGARDAGQKKDAEPAPGASVTAAPPKAAPAAPAQAAPSLSERPEAAAAGAKSLFAADVAEGVALSCDAGAAPLDLLAELALHRSAETPLCVGILGPAGSGKSVVLNTLLDRIERLAAAAKRAPGSPFVGEALTLRLEAADLEGHPATAIAGALYGRLAIDAPQLGLEASHAARDPGLAAREAFERLDAASRQLQAERRLLEEAEAHRARLTDTVLYETPGSKVDADVARHRGVINAAMARFGFGGDAVAAYKDMVRTLADSRGASRVSFVANLFWGLKGQANRLIWAAVLALVAFGVGLAQAHQGAWIGWIAAQPEMGEAAGFASRNVGWLEVLRLACYAGAALAVASNLWRGGRLLRLLSRSDELLKADLADKRRESDGFIAHQARRAHDLGAEVERLSRKAAEAERRAGGQASAAASEPSPFAADLVRQQAQRFIAAVGAQLDKADAGPPRRIILALDGLDRVEPARARELLGFSPGRGFVEFVALDPAAIAGGPDELARWIAAPLSVPELYGRRDPAEQMRALLGAREAGAPAPAAPDATRSALDEPLGPDEEALLQALAPIAGTTARALKRFFNLYHLLRALAPARARPALALALALDCAGARADFAALETSILGPGDEPTFDHHRIGPRLAAALRALASAHARIGREELREAIAEVRLFSLPA